MRSLGKLLIVTALVFCIPSQAKFLCKLFGWLGGRRGSSEQLRLPRRVNDAQWRAKASNRSTGDGKPLPTDAGRENDIVDAVEAMVGDITNDSTPALRFVTAAGTDLDPKAIVYAGDGMHYKVTKAEGGVFKATLLLPVSAHDGFKLAEKWSTTDTYDVWAEMPDGTRKMLATAARSRDLITLHDVEVPMVQGKTVRVFYSRKGSAGPWGFPQGRILHLTWDGN